MESKPMILDEKLPVSDEVIAVHRVVDASPETTWQAVRELDFLSVHTPLLDAAFWARMLPARLRGHRPPPPRGPLRLAGGENPPGWVTLGETPGAEIAFGAIGRFWQWEIHWHEVPAAGFPEFAEPGYGKIGCNFTVRPYGAGRTLLSYECRVAMTDPRSRRQFTRYWRLVRPFVGHVMRAVVAAADAGARRRATAPARPVPVS